MTKIRVLPPQVADRIAAGEVVDRPASVLREVLDNALDAGASRIDVDILGGGRERICVADDGHGMSRDDAVLAFERHATSKIATGADLDAVSTLGFRGEALAAIAAVARVTLVTRERGSEAGVRVVLDKGRLVKVEPAPRAPGSTLDVRELFGSVPARRKFLRTVGTELDHSLRAVRRAALARPSVAFRVRHEGRTVLDLPGAGSRHARIRSILGDRLGGLLVEIDAEAGPVVVRGWVGRTDAHRPTRDGLHVFVNARPVRDAFLMRAVQDGFGNTLPPGRFPVAVLDIEMPPDEVDVNVHPAKSEVRFAKPREIRALVAGAVREALGGDAALPGLRGMSAVGAGRSPAGGAAAGGEARASADDAAAVSASSSLWDADRLRARADGAVSEMTSGWKEQSGHTSADQGPPTRRALAQHRRCYILAEDADGLLVVDQHVAHERLLYEKLVGEAHDRPLPRQVLLFPAVLELDPEDAEVARDQRALLERCGFVVEPFGGDAVKVSEVPSVYGREAAPEALLTILEQIRRGEPRLGEPMLHLLLATVACHTAVRKGDALSLEKMDYLLSGLDACEAPHHCPHGRVVSLRVDLSTLDDNFDR
jgi:DNA mismatch repair protein MutL